MFRAPLIALVLLLAIACAPASSLAGDTWTSPFTGVQRLYRTNTSPNWHVNVAVVDLCASGVSIRATRPAERQQTPSSFGTAVGAEVVVNGDFFSFSTYNTSGLAVGAGEVWPSSSDSASSAFLAFGAGRAYYSAAGLVETPAAWMQQLVSGHPAIIQGGTRVNNTSTLCTARHPRTAAGLSADGQTLILAVVDGRSTTSVGMTCNELAALMEELGAYNAVNLDGGGSSAMWMRGLGVVNTPSDGTQRVVANHLAVVADGTGTPGSCDATLPEVIQQAHIVDATQSTDVNGDGIADICTRRAAGWRCQLSDSAGFPTIIDTTLYASTSGWSDQTNYATLRMGDINGDGLDDVCARANVRVVCALSDGAGFPTTIDGPEWSDASGWDHERYYSTIRLLDFNGDGMADICARASTGMRCHASTGVGFGPMIAGPELSNASGWGDPDHYATIRAGDVNGDGLDDLCARGTQGMFCWPSTGGGFGPPIAGPIWSDANSWSQLRYWSTIRLRDIDGDGLADLCARTATDFRCHLATGDGFGPAVVGPSWRDDVGWGDTDNFSTIRLGDIDGDGDLDVCARANAGFRCYPWTGDGFGSIVPGPELSNAAGFDQRSSYATIQLADVTGDGLDDVCARFPDGVRCFASDGLGFSAAISGPQWTDAVGWLAPQYYSSIRVRGPACRRAEEVCDGVDNDCDGQTDEGCAADPAPADTSAPDTSAPDTSMPDTSMPDTHLARPDVTLTDVVGARPDASSGDLEAGIEDEAAVQTHASDCACAVRHQRSPRVGWLLIILAGTLVWRRRKR